MPYLNALLNSIVKYKLQERAEFDVLVLTDGTLSAAYKESAKKLGYNIRFKTIDTKAAGLEESWSGAWKCKAGRYYHMMQEGRNYDVCCLMDADLYITNQEFVDFFDFVAGTNNIIGCNERIKWNISNIYTLNGKPVLDKEQRLFKFHCNVPLFLDTKKWEDVIKDYLTIVYRGKEMREGEEKIIGDLYSWNMAVYRQGREKDVFMLPMQSTTQVHRTGYRDKNCVLKKEGKEYWRTEDGDTVYCLHGRPDRAGFRSIELKNEFEKHNIDKGLFNRYASLAEREWLDVNFNYAIDLRTVWPKDEAWDKMGR